MVGSSFCLSALQSTMCCSMNWMRSGTAGMGSGMRITCGMFHSDLSVGCNAFMVFLSALAHATAFRSRIGRAQQDELEWQHVFEFSNRLTWKSEREELVFSVG